MRPRLLIVESEPDLLALFRMFFPTTRYDVELAETLGAAHCVLSRKTFDLVLLELVLPDGDGLVLCDELSATRPDLPVAVVTTRVGAGERVRAAGARAFITKPFEPDALIATVEEVLAARPPESRRV